ncbi:tRNA pseudouridine(38,39,40) synthase TruA [Pseudoalteromonas luteoviolacea]|uniref:tRNA pseudouridine synthase A n=1 Tax=Pseudoalteromonas luteoviolacea TaxID=43657 RepID=A0A1C0TJY9_9GAMM|nr:tRNA pseudouridine(38-40) synthase TruA [Pseudoalteromonas luteoviolacea]OCQ18864.1 tRNA pseudouridine(38,39,40) synthase TruA [Pseudoalteromonas luteoviolacea]
MRVVLGIEYNGGNYSGWQRQSHVSSVQEKIETALSRICNHPVDIVCAGRTDAGVHATGQLVHFDTDAQREMSAFTLGMNSQLPDDIAVRFAQQVDEEFHARFSATARRYRYIIYNHTYRPGILRNGVTHFHQPLDVERMQAACPFMLGEQDFTSFRAVHCQSNTPFRNIHHLQVDRFGDYVVIDVKANAFLHHMVRNITGCLLDIGTGEQEPGWMGELLKIKDRTQASATAKPNGLYLVDVDYPEKWGIPKMAVGPLFLPEVEIRK